MIKILCDRCGVDITGKTLKSHSPGAPIFQISYFRSDSDEKYIDLCQKCNDALNDWIGKAEEIPEDRTKIEW